ncbi:hypothetical protein D3C75_899550 [compost metagenome]
MIGFISCSIESAADKSIVCGSGAFCRACGIYIPVGLIPERIVQDPGLHIQQFLLIGREDIVQAVLQRSFIQLLETVQHNLVQKQVVNPQGNQGNNTSEDDNFFAQLHDAPL